MSLTPNEMAWLPYVQSVIASRPQFAWIKPSWIMAFINREGGFADPLVVNASGVRDGPMQVIPETVVLVEKAYGYNILLPQTDPFTSILTGTSYVDLVARQLLAGLGRSSLPLDDVVQSYHSGPAAFLAGSRRRTYLLNWLKSQGDFAWVDGAGAVVVT